MSCLVQLAKLPCKRVHQLWFVFFMCSVCVCACVLLLLFLKFMSDLVGHPENRFSRDAARIEHRHKDAGF